MITCGDDILQGEAHRELVKLGTPERNTMRPGWLMGFDRALDVWLRKRGLMHETMAAASRRGHQTRWGTKR